MLVQFVVFLPLAILLMSFVIDMANWWEHRRHLQTQADAAALAGASAIGIPCTADTSAAVAQVVQDYSGGKYNAQVGGAQEEGRVHMMMNSKTWWNQTDQVDSTVDERPACQSGMVDVKMTENDLPWFFRPLEKIGWINTQARVELRQADFATGMLPVGVPDVDPKRAKVTLVDEEKTAGAAGWKIDEFELTEGGGGTCPEANGLARWCNKDLERVDIGRAERIGVRVALSGTKDSVTCGDPLVTCFDAADGRFGLAHVRGFEDASAGDPEPKVETGERPHAKTVRLGPTGCGPAVYFTSSVDGATCYTGAYAEVDAAVDPEKVELTASAGNVTEKLPYTGTGRAYHLTETKLPVPAAAGRVPVTLAWEQTSGTVAGETCTTTGKNPCKGTFGAVQRAFSAQDERSGPIRALRVLDGAGAEAHSVQRCTEAQRDERDAGGKLLCEHDLRVEVGLVQKFQNAQSDTEPFVQLKVAGGGSQNQSLDCDPAGTNLRDEIVRGCGPRYGENGGKDPCTYNNATEVFAKLPAILRCVAISTGAAVNQVSAGMNERILGDEQASVCTAPNNWWKGRARLLAEHKGDKRFVKVFLTPYGAFSGSGSGAVPVTGFATFYVTGWSGSGAGFDNPCEDASKFPASVPLADRRLDDTVPNKGRGYIVGHFISYINPYNDGSAGKTPCDMSGGTLGNCVAVLTK